MENKVSSECKNCGSELVYDPIKQTLACAYCETHYHLPKAKMDAVLVRGYSNAFHPNVLNKSLNCFRCEMCGHTYFTASGEKSRECQNCGSASCEKIQSSGYCADGIIPFEISKQQAAKKFENYLKSKPQIPKDMLKQAKEQNLTGVFVPVWNFIFDIDSTYTANAAELKKDTNGMYYTVPIPVFGTKGKSVKSADQCATSTETDELLDLFDENDYDKIIPYAPEYTFGYKVDDINRSIHDYFSVVTENEENKLKKEVSNYILNNYKDVTNMNVDTSSRDIYFNFTYVPVYINTYTYRGKIYKTYISGTTGKVAGSTPRSIKSIFKLLIKYLGLVAAIAVLAYFLFK